MPVVCGNLRGFSTDSCVGSPGGVCFQLNMLQASESYTLFPPHRLLLPPVCLVGTVLPPPQSPFPECPLLLDISHSPSKSDLNPTPSLPLSIITSDSELIPYKVIITNSKLHPVHPCDLQLSDHCTFWYTHLPSPQLGTEERHD